MKEKNNRQNNKQICQCQTLPPLFLLPSCSLHTEIYFFPQSCYLPPSRHRELLRLLCFSKNVISYVCLFITSKKKTPRANSCLFHLLLLLNKICNHSLATKLQLCHLYLILSTVSLFNMRTEEIESSFFFRCGLFCGWISLLL